MASLLRPRCQLGRSVNVLTTEEVNVAKWLVIVESNCVDPAREDEFNEWYNKIHLPDLMPKRGPCP